MAPSTRASDDESAPPDGQVVTLRFDGREVSVWWGSDGDIDRLAVRARRVMTWPTAEACEEHGRRAGWTWMKDDDGAILRDTVDCEPVQAWLRGQRPTLDPVSALNMWNFQWDVTASLTGAYPLPLRRAESRCHTLLTGAHVPWLTGQDSYRPQWTAADLRCLRQVLNRALHDFRTTLADE
jgi:hypothetical protein